jgi:hypothetical protein
MKKLIVLMVFVAGLVTMAKAQDTAAEFKFETEMHDFGKIPLHQTAVFVFNFTNVGDIPLVITKVESTCGCAVAAYTQSPIKKGEKGFVKVSMTPTGAALPFNKAITLTSNARTTTKVLYVKGISVAQNSN